MTSSEDILIIVAIILLISILVQVLYLTTLSRTIRNIRPEFRKVEPGQAWLGMIPLFHLIWPFIINRKVADSIKADLEDRGMGEDGDYGKNIGTIYPAVRFGGNVPGIGVLFSIAYLVIFIMWWSKLSRYRALLAGGSIHNDELLDN